MSSLEAAHEQRAIGMASSGVHCTDTTNKNARHAEMADWTGLEPHLLLDSMVGMACNREDALTAAAIWGEAMLGCAGGGCRGLRLL